MEISETTRFENFKNGNEISFKEIFHEYYPPLCSFARSYLFDPDSCEDIVQEVMLSVWLKRQEFSDFRSFKAYLYTAVKNACLNIRKHEKVREKHEKEIIFLESEAFFQDTLIEEEVHRILFESYKSLPEQCNRVLHLCYFDGYRLNEVASELNITVNTVKTQKYRALRIIRDNFEKLSKCILCFPFLFP